MISAIKFGWRWNLTASPGNCSKDSGTAFVIFSTRAAEWLEILAAGWVATRLLVLCLTLGLLCGLTLALTEGSLTQLRLLWLWRFRRDGAALNPREATLVYEGLLRILQKKGVQRTVSQTPREFAHQISVTPLGSAVREFTELYTSLRFGRLPVSVPRLRQLLDAIRRAAL